MVNVRTIWVLRLSTDDQEKNMNITVYMGSNPGKNPAYREAAKELGRFIGGNGHTLVYGGSDAGLMGVVADNVLETGGMVIGVFPRTLKGIESQHPRLDKLLETNDLRERRAKMIALGDVFVALPGGPGTIEEISEIMSLARIGHLKGLCTILNVEGYFDHFKAQYDKMVEEGFISPAERGRIIFLDSLDELKKLM